jgi:hypothetical protein
MSGAEAQSILARLRAVLAPLATPAADMQGWRFDGLALAGTGFEARFRRGAGQEARLRFTRPGSGPAWHRVAGADVGLVLDAAGRLPEPGLPQDHLAARLDAGLGGPTAEWPRWDPAPPVLVVVSGIPRAGTAWVKRLARGLIEGAGHPLGGADGSGDATLPRRGALAEHAAAAAPLCAAHERAPARVRLAKAHYFADATAWPDVRVLFVYRDLRDAFASQLDRAVNGPARAHFPGLSAAATWDALVGEVLPVAAEALARLADAPPATTWLLRYEDLLADLGTETRRLARWLGIVAPDDVLELLAAEHSFAGEAGRAAGASRSGAYHRRGVAGGWREDLTPAQVEAIHRVVPDHDGLLARVDAVRRARHGAGA